MMFCWQKKSKWQKARYLQPSGRGLRGNWPSEATKWKEKGSTGEGEEERQKGDEDYL